MYIIFCQRDKELTEVMREWLRGGVQPCQGWGRGFESLLALVKKRIGFSIRFFVV